MVNISRFYKYIILVGSIIIAVTMVAGCIGTVTENTSVISGADESSQNMMKLSYEIREMSSSTTSVPVYLSRGEEYEYTDATRNNKMTVTVKKNTGNFTYSLEYLDASLDKRVKLTPDTGNKFLYLFMQYHHSGIENVNKNHNMTTPNLAFHRLLDADGNEYRPVSLNSKYTYSFFGKNYVPTVLNRWDGDMDFEGYLLFEVPENMTLDGSYLKINLGKWGSPMWRLWD